MNTIVPSATASSSSPTSRPALLFEAMKVTRYGWPAESCAGASSRQVCRIDLPGACGDTDLLRGPRGWDPPARAVILTSSRSPSPCSRPKLGCKAHSRIRREFQDQAALSGLLARLEASGVEIVNVPRVHDQDSAVS